MSEKKSRVERKFDFLKDAEPIRQEIIDACVEEGKLSIPKLMDHLAMHIACHMLKIREFGDLVQQLDSRIKSLEAELANERLTAHHKRLEVLEARSQNC